MGRWSYGAAAAAMVRDYIVGLFWRERGCVHKYDHGKQSIVIVQCDVISFSFHHHHLGLSTEARTKEHPHTKKG